MGPLLRPDRVRPGTVAVLKVDRPSVPAHAVVLVEDCASMLVGVSIFEEFNLPNSTTWFYFSLLLAMALFFRFTRLLSVRNLDVVGLFLLTPGLLILLQAQTQARHTQEEMPTKVAALVLETATSRVSPGTGLASAIPLATAASQVTDTSTRLAGLFMAHVRLGCFFSAASLTPSDARPGAG